MDAVACRDCDLLHAAGPIPSGARARCVRCGGALALPGTQSTDTPLALAVAALITFGIANAAPLMQMSELGQVASTTIAGSTVRMWIDGSEPAAALVALCSIAAPGAYLVLAIAALWATRREAAPRWAGTFLRWAAALHPWAMPEVMLLGTLVAYVKIAQLAHASAGIGMYATGALAGLIAWLGSSLDAAALWPRIRRAH